MAFEIIVTSICICLIRFASCEESYVSSVFDKTISSCSDLAKKVYTVTCEMQCIHRCMRNQKCSTINYRNDDDVTENCEVFVGGHCSTTEESKNWKAMAIKAFCSYSEDMGWHYLGSKPNCECLNSVSKKFSMYTK